jgi:hypothetical protein
MPLSRFNVEDWNRLTPSQRVAQCRRIAKEARTLATQGNGAGMTNAYLEVARGWENLADEIEQQSSASPLKS